MTATRTRTPGGFYAVEGATTDLDAAMYDAVAAFAEEAGLPAATDRDIMIAACQPVSMASAYADLCAALGIPAPAFIRRALA
jgi:hypothetical protein